jgi:hypothetical protein
MVIGAPCLAKLGDDETLTLNGELAAFAKAPTAHNVAASAGMKSDFKCIFSCELCSF